MSTVTLDLGGNAKDIVDGFGKAADSVEDLNEEVKEFDKTSKKAFSDSTKAAQGFGKAVDDVGNKQKKEIGIIQKLEDDLKKLKKTRLEANSTKEIKKLNEEIDKQEKKLNNLTNTTKKTGLSFKEIAKGALAFTGISAGITLVQNGFRRVIGTVGDFDKATSELKAITGLDDAAFGDFDKKIKEVASQTKKSAVDVAKAFQLIGSADASLLTSADALGSVTEAAITLAKAGGLEVPEAATALTKAMNQFGASASDATEFTDILAASQQKGTATIAELSESMKNVGAIANAAGISFKDTTIALQALAKGGLTGAEAGTGLRSVYSKLANQTRDELNPTLNSMTDIIKTLSGENIGLKEASALVGEESAKTLLTLIAQEKTLNDLTVAMDDVSGSASDQAITATANMNDRWEEFNNTIDNAIIQFASGENALSGFVSEIINVATEVVNLITGNEKLEQTLSDTEKETRATAKTFITIVKVIGTIIVAFKAWQLAMKVGLAVQKAIAIATRAFTIVQAGLQNALKIARIAQLAFNAAVSANPIGILILVLTAAVAAFAAFASGADEAAIAQEALNEANERGSRISKKRIAEINQGLAVQLKALNNEKTLRAAAGEDQKKLDAEFLKRQQDILEKERLNNANRSLSTAKEAQRRVEIINKELDEIDKLQDESNEISLKNAAGLLTNTKNIEDATLQARREALIKQRASIRGNAAGINKERIEQDKALLAQISDFQVAQQVIINEGNKTLSDKEKKAAEKKRKLKEKELKKLEALERKFQADLAKLAIDSENIDIQRLEGSKKFEAIEAQRNREIDLIKKNLEDQKEAIGKGSELEQEQLDQIANLRKKAAEERVLSQMKFDEDQRKTEADSATKSLDLQEQIAIERVAQFQDDALSETELERAKQIRLLEIQAEFAQKRLDALGTDLTEEQKLVKLQLQNQINDIQDQRDKLNKEAEDNGFSMAKLLGVTKEEFAEIKDALSIVGNEVLNATQNLFAAQQEANQQLIDGINSRIDETEEALQTELDLNAQGFASNVEGKRAELEELKAAREAALKQQEQLAKKQFLLDTALQASSLITSAANIIKATSPITPPFGQILAGIAIATISGLFISAKLQAFKAIGSGQQLEKGGKLDRLRGGRPHKRGGNRIEGTDVEVEMDEWVLNSKVSNEHDNFLERMNAGDYNGVNLDKLLNGTGVTVDKNIPRKIENKNNIITRKTSQLNAALISDEMIGIMSNVDGNLEKFFEYEKNKKQVHKTSYGRIETVGNHSVKIHEKDKNNES